MQHLPPPLLTYARELLERVYAEVSARLRAERGEAVTPHASVDELLAVLAAQPLGDGVTADARPTETETEEGVSRKRARSSASSHAASFREAVRAVASSLRGDLALAESLLFTGSTPLCDALAASAAERARCLASRDAIAAHHLALRAAVVPAAEEARRAAWARAVEEEEALERYAEAAVHTGRRAFVRDAQTLCREWALDFFRAGAAKAALKAERRAVFGERGSKAELSAERRAAAAARVAAALAGSPPRLLDVGSCHDPWRPQHPRVFDVTALDLAPAAAQVWRCDFLALRCLAGGATESVPPAAGEAGCGALRALPSAAFHVVVLSLVLSYIPDARARTAMVHKARLLLRSEAGLLLIVTVRRRRPLSSLSDALQPNSSFGPAAVTASGVPPILAEWRAAVEALGFERYAYERQPTVSVLAFRAVGEAPPEQPQLAPMRIARDSRALQ